MYVFVHTNRARVMNPQGLPSGELAHCQVLARIERMESQFVWLSSRAFAESLSPQRSQRKSAENAEKTGVIFSSAFTSGLLSAFSAAFLCDLCV
jgi:hypothetical protein